MENQLEIQWKDVLDYEGLYQISSDGQVYSFRREQIVEPYLHKTGFLCINLTKDGIRSNFAIHRLVLEAFLVHSVKGQQIRFKNGKKLDVRLENLLLVPRKPKPTKKGFVTRLWENIKVGNDNECWPWTGALNGAGYGSLGLNGKSIMAHRASWIFHFGAIDETSSRIVVMHLCDNRLCCNPAHLKLGTHQDNTKDCIEKGRFRPFGHEVRPSTLSNGSERQECNCCHESRSIDDFYFGGAPRKDGSRYRMRVCRFCFNKKYAKKSQKSFV